MEAAGRHPPGALRPEVGKSPCHPEGTYYRGPPPRQATSPLMEYQGGCACAVWPVCRYSFWNIRTAMIRACSREALA